MTQQAPHATDRSAQPGRRSVFDFSRVTSLLRPTASSPDPDPQTPTIGPATAQEDRALSETDYRRSLRGLGDLQAAPPSHQPPAVEPTLIPEDQRISQGTRVLITAPGEAPDHGDMTHFLNGIENAIPDLVLIHSHAPGAESMTHDWARNRGIPQIVYAPHPDSETPKLRAARLDAMIHVADPSRIYDLSERGVVSPLTELARERNRPVVHARELIKRSAVRAPTGNIIEQPGSRVVMTGPGVAADPEALSGVLTRLRNAVPDLVLVHANHPGAERMIGKWAEQNNVPQIVLAPGKDPTEQAESARLGALFHKDPVRVYDLSAPDQNPDVARAARERGFAVAQAHSAVTTSPAQNTGIESRQEIGQSVPAPEDRNMAPRARISHSY